MQGTDKRKEEIAAAIDIYALFSFIREPQNIRTQNARSGISGIK